MDRHEDVRALEALRAPHTGAAPRLLVVSGSAGVGKTALAVRWLNGLGEEFPDGRLYADLAAHTPGGPADPADVLERLLRSLGVTHAPQGLAERTVLWRTLTAELRIGVLLDNASSAQQVRPLLPASPGGLVVVTSRSRLSGLLMEDAALHQLGAPAPDAAVELLALAGGGDRVRQDPQAARDLVTVCGCLPLAVRLAAAQLAVHPRRTVAELAATLSRGRSAPGEPRAESGGVVTAALDATYRLLPPYAARTYRRLGLLPTARYDRSLAAAVCDRHPDGIDADLAALSRAGLLEEHGRGGQDVLGFHDLVRAHAGRCGEADETAAAREETVRRFADWCLRTASVAEELLTPGHHATATTGTAHRPAHTDTDACTHTDTHTDTDGCTHTDADADAAGAVVPPDPAAVFKDPAHALAWLDAERQTLLAAARHSAAAGRDRVCWQLVDAMWPLFVRLRPSAMWIEAHELGLAAARRAGDRTGEARMLASGGTGLHDAGRYEEAAEWYALALRYAEEDGDPYAQAQALDGLGSSRLHVGELDEAEGFFTRALTFREDTGQPRGAALSRLRLGGTALARGDHGTAAGHLAQARTALVQTGDVYDAARALALLGQATAASGDRDVGEHQLRKAAADFRLTGARHREARALEVLGQLAQQAGETDAARDRYEQAHGIVRALSPADTLRLEARLSEL